MGDVGGTRAQGPKCIALVGPYLSGKTTLLEAILARTGALTRQGKVSEGSTLGDGSPEARAHGMSVEINVASTDFLGDSYTFIDCPGSVEFLSEAAAVLPAVDAAIVVCEPDEKKVPALQLILKQLEDLGIPRILFLNKVDKADARVRDMLSLLQPASTVPLVLRQVPIWENNIVTGFVDLALERAFVYREHKASEVIDMPAAIKDREEEARYSMLEQLADYDDKLMEQLLEDIPPPRDRVFDDLRREVNEGLIVPVLLGSAENGNGILRLLKALRHESPGIEATLSRLSIDKGDAARAQVLKTFHTTHGGKLSLVRLLTGDITDGTILRSSGGAEERVSGVFNLMGQEPKKRDKAVAGETVALGRLEHVRTGETLAAGRDQPAALAMLDLPSPVHAIAVNAKERKDEVKLTAAIGKIIEEDPSLVLEHSQEAAEMILWGQGEMHLRVALERLTGKYGVSLSTHRAHVPYKETIRKSVTQRGRHKKQSGGHGQFGDVVLDIKPLPRGAGFEFTQTIHGGSVPRQFHSSVEAGVRDYLSAGPLGFPVVDVAVTLTDGSYHSVDSSDMAFRAAARLAMSEGMANCQPVLLEPIMNVQIHVPSDATSRVNAIVSSRRGQILGFDARAGWPGWDTVEANMPAAEMDNLIVELRSATAGVGAYTFSFDHLAELTGKLADQVLAASKAEAA